MRRARGAGVVPKAMFTANAYGGVAARLAGVKAVISEEQCVDQWKGRLRLGVDRILARAGSRIVANSDSVARWLSGVGIAADLVETIPAAFDPAGYAAKPPEPGARVGSPPRLVAVGRMSPPNPHAVLLEALVGSGATVGGRSIDDRQQNGPCRHTNELLNVTGIGQAVYSRIEPLISVAD